LGLRPSEVSAILKAQAEQMTQERGMRGELAPLRHCLINEQSAQTLLDHPQSSGSKLAQRSQATDDADSGLAQIFVTRWERNTLIVGSYLVDYWCLGVKNCFGPRKMDQHKYDQLVRQSYASFTQDSREITLEQAQSIIWGAVDYATGLGFSPHADFEAAKAHLDQRIEPLQPIQFGREGKPCYVSGPHDNPNRIVAKLRETVGEGNFNFLLQA
jgi:hypothetical protein